MPLVKRTVIKVNDIHYNPQAADKAGLFKEFKKEEGHENREEMVIDIKTHLVPDIFKTSSNPQGIEEDTLKSLPFKIKPEEALRISRDILNILRNPALVAKYLKPLDEELGREMDKTYNVGENKYQDSDLPDSVITARGFFMPGPPPKNYKPRNQGRLLDEILLKREAEAGINSEGFTSKFVGFVDPIKANKHVSEGHIFGEDVQVENLLLHGKYSHRLDFEIIRNAAKPNSKTGIAELDLSIETEDGKKRVLSQKELLQMMVTTYLLPRGNSAWQQVIDILDDVKDNFEIAVSEKPNSIFDIIGVSPIDKDRKKLFSPKNYSFSSQSPEILNSLILCFGKDLEIPNLQHYMLNSHYKEVAQMVGRAREIVAEEEVRPPSFLKKLADSVIKNPASIAVEPKQIAKDDFSNMYIHCMKSLAKLGSVNPGVIVATPLTFILQQAGKSKKYAQFQEDELGNSKLAAVDRPDPAIKKKVTAPNQKIDESLDDYILRKAEQTKRETPESKITPGIFASLLKSVGIIR